MLINWFTVVAQIINFLVLVWLLKRFLYKPVLNAIDEREKNIASQLKDAEKKELEAKNQSLQYQKEKQELEKNKEALMVQAQQEAESVRRNLLENARQEATAQKEKLMKAILEHQENVQREIRQNVTTEVFGIARKVLTDLAGERMETSVVKAFIKKLSSLSQEEKSKFSQAFQKVGELLVRSAFELDENDQKAIGQSLRDAFALSLTFRFEVRPDLISGVEINCNGYKLSWSIDDYLLSLKNSVEDAIQSLHKN